jgi:urea transport system ATP-binding protein
LERPSSTSKARVSLFAWLGDDQRDMVSDTLKQIRLYHEAERPAGLLSHGQKQWLEIGMLLVQDPKLLLLDEPVAGIPTSASLPSRRPWIRLASARGPASAARS